MREAGGSEIHLLQMRGQLAGTNEAHLKLRRLDDVPPRHTEPDHRHAGEAANDETHPQVLTARLTERVGRHRDRQSVQAAALDQFLILRLIHATRGRTPAPARKGIGAIRRRTRRGIGVLEKTRWRAKPPTLALLRSGGTVRVAGRQHNGRTVRLTFTHYASPEIDQVHQRDHALLPALAALENPRCLEINRSADGNDDISGSVQQRNRLEIPELQERVQRRPHSFLGNDAAKATLGTDDQPERGGNILRTIDQRRAC